MYNLIKGHKEYVYNKSILNRRACVRFVKTWSFCMSSLCEGCAKVNIRAAVFCTVYSESNDVETEDTVIQYLKWINNNDKSNLMKNK